MTNTELGRMDSRAVRSQDGRDPLTANGFNMQDLGASEDAPPAYSDRMDALQLSQAGFEAAAAVADDGRVNIRINESNRKFAALIAPAIRNQMRPEETPPNYTLPPAYIPPSLGGAPGQTPPPKLNLVIQIVGSRGDVQPFVALGKVLKDTYGHRVRLATHSTFQKFVEENGLEFFNIGGDPAELMAFMVKNPGLMPGMDAMKSGEITKRRKGIEEIVLGCWRSCIEAGTGLGPPPQPHKPNQPLDDTFTLPGDPNERPFVADAIIANPPSFAHIHIAEKLGIPFHMMFTMPWSPTKAFPHPLANIQSSNSDEVMTNYMSYALVEMMTWQGLGDVINRFRTKILDLEPLSLIWAPGLLARLHIPTTYCWSPALIPKPNDWNREISIAGFYFLNLASSYTPEPDLAAFLADGPPPIYIGFGSIVVDDPNHLTRMIFDAVSVTGVRALVSKGWGGLGADSVGIPEGVFMLGNCPHDWLFKHVSAVVHHGGAGTSAAGIVSGRPTVVVPFFGDQPFWGAMIHRAGAGPEPIPYKTMTAENLAAAIKECLKPETQGRAQELGHKIREEKGADMGGKCFHEHLNVPDLRCNLAPSRVAVWRVRRSKTRLSALAAAVLVEEGKLKYSDMKLYRSMEYITEDQPWDPISAATAALVGDISGITMAIADIPRGVFKGAKKNSSNAGTPSTEHPPAGPSSSSNNESSSMATSDSAHAGSRSQQAELAGSDTASLASTHPSINVSVPGTSTHSNPAGTSSTDITSLTQVTSPERVLSPSRSQETERSSTSGPDKGKSPSRRTSSPCPAGSFAVETAVDTGKGVGRIVTTGMKSPMNFCLGLAKGFRNAPKLYNDDTVRQPEKVTDFATGLKVAGKEFGLGLFDGISGLVMQPLKGAEKEGGVGLVKGFGKGIGGLVLKPAAAFWSIPAYTMQGVHAEVRSLFSRSVQNYIVTARILQGKEDMHNSTPQEREDISKRWDYKKDDLKGFYNLKQKEDLKEFYKQRERKSQSNIGTDVTSGEAQDEPPKTGWLHTKHLSIDERRKLHQQKEEWNRRNQGSVSRPSNPADDNDQFERAIQESVRQTSHGDPDEDARIEQAIRASVLEMRRIADFSRDEKRPIPDVSELDDTSVTPGVEGITDEEYQQLIAKAVQQSLAEQQAAAALGHSSPEEDEDFKKAVEESRTYLPGGHVDVDPEEMRRAIEESKVAGTSRHATDDDEEMQRAIQESEQAHRAQLSRSKTEEEVVMEFVKKQSLAEEEYRRQQAKGKGKHSGGDDDDEDLKKAMEESLSMSGKHGESSNSRGEEQPPKDEKDAAGKGAEAS